MNDSIRIIGCKDTGEALDRLAENIKEASQGKSVFEAPEHRIIIPSLVNRYFVDIQLAKRETVLTRINYDTLKWSVLRLARDLSAEDIEKNLTERDIFAHLLMLLSPEGLDYCFRDAPGEYKRYLAGYLQEDGEEKADSRRDTLAAKLASLFIRYKEEAPDIIDKWDQRIKENGGGYEGEAEGAEYFLYKSLLEAGTLKDGFLLEKADIPDGSGIVAHVLGYDYIPASTLSGLKKLAENGMKVNIYYEKPKRFNEENTALLKAWNKINGKAAYNLKKEDGAGKDKPTEDLPKDKTISFIPCAGPEREAEAVWNSVCSNLKKDIKIRPEDICVLICDPEKYYPEMERVFLRKEPLAAEQNTEQKKTRCVPFNLACVRPTPGSNYLEGIKALFRLLDSNMERFRIEALFTNPCFLNCFGLEYTEVLKWLETECGAWGYFDDTEEDPAPDGYHTWKSAARRMRLAGASREEWENVIPDAPSFTDTGNRLPALTEMLYRDIARLKKLDKENREPENKNRLFKKEEETDKKNELCQNVFDEVSAFIKRWLRPGKEEKGMAGFTDSRLDSFRYQCETRNYVPLTRDIRCFLESTMDPMQFEHGKPFEKGVMTGHIGNIKMPAFKILYLMGFNEDVFPSKDTAPSIDLTAEREDAVTKKDLDRYAFLKAALSAERVYITWDCKDRLKGTDKYPSSCVTELMDLTLSKEEIKKIKDQIKDEEKKPALFGRTVINTDEGSTEDDWTLTYHQGDVLERLAEEDYKKYGAEKPETTQNLTKNEDKREFTVKQISKFLLNPAEYYLEYVLGISDFEPADKNRRFAPPATDKKNKWRYEREAVTSSLLQRKDWAEAAGDAYDVYRKLGMAPEKAAAELEKELLILENTWPMPEEEIKEEELQAEA
ncbi:MAG: exodeoxyribonuclease V subunit gamma, partial [Abditibacteriota bacterium]|nr:exodeoxyribonuclease V subunit gamma [Abditibacteriota bacterium]